MHVRLHCYSMDALTDGETCQWVHTFVPWENTSVSCWGSENDIEEILYSQKFLTFANKKNCWHSVHQRLVNWVNLVEL